MKTCAILGTRPEAIKLFPVVRELTRRNHTVTVYDTQQQKSAVSEFFIPFAPDANHKKLSLPLINQFLSTQISLQIQEIEMRLSEEKYDVCLVHGDTNSTLIGALGAFYAKTPIVHVEAGLRSGNSFSPFPEEMNRQLVSKLATYHAAPTENSRMNLLRECCNVGDIVVSGNTVIDAISLIRESIKRNDIFADSILKQGCTILIACHRRENRERALSMLCAEIREASYSAADFVVMLHPNPIVSEIYRSKLEGVGNVKFVEPLGYIDFVRLLDSVDGVITDSGGIQEEVTYLNKPTVIFRSETERPEVLDANYVQLCADFPFNAVVQLQAILNSSHEVPSAGNLFGDGLASAKIVNFIESKL
jgi:UDP-N-acetylglucosamine 2-epimerase (non-hydrolysing)